MKPYRTNRNRALIRHHRNRVIQRKKRLAGTSGWSLAHDGSLSKGKIHCSCYWCSEKTKRLGFPKPEAARIAGCREQIAEVNVSR